MIYLLLSILSSSLIFLIFKWLGRLQVSTFLVIVFNYLFAGLIGWSIQGEEYIPVLINSNWKWYAIGLGSTFVGMFYLMAIATQRAGTSPAVVANKMSVVIPVIVAFILYGDSVTILKLLGILTALFGIVLVTRNPDRDGQMGAHFWLLLFLFLGSGFIDTSIKWIEINFLSDVEIMAFTSTLFLTAFSIGSLIFLSRAKSFISRFQWKKVWLGLFLGSVNFGSIYFLVLALKSGGLQSSVLFPVNNIGIVLLSSLGSRLLFKEHLSRNKIIGITVSVIALVILMYS